MKRGERSGLICIKLIYWEKEYILSRRLHKKCSSSISMKIISIIKTPMMNNFAKRGIMEEWLRYFIAANNMVSNLLISIHHIQVNVLIIYSQRAHIHDKTSICSNTPVNHLNMGYIVYLFKVRQKIWNIHVYPLSTTANWNSQYYRTTLWRSLMPKYSKHINKDTNYS